MPLDKDYYQILHVHPSAKPEVIRAAYKRLSRKYHPDINKSPDATRRMQEINEAYEILNNPQKRAEYDRRKGHPSPETEVERQARERQQKLATLYERGVQLSSQNKWAEAIAVFDELLGLDPAYRDAPAKRQAAQRALEKRQRAAKLAQLYSEAMENFRAERWQLAIDAFKEIQRLDPDDPYMAHLLRDAKRQNRLANLYADAEKYMRLEAWRDAIIRFESILSQSPDYRDVAERLKQAQRQQWMADLSDQATKYVQQKRFAEAEKIREQIRQVRDSDVLPPVPPQPKPASPPVASSSMRPTWQTEAGIVAILVLLVIGFVLIMSGLTPTQAPTPVPLPTATVALVLSTSAQAAVTTRIADKDGMIMVYVPAGEFLMGSTDLDSMALDGEKPQHLVYLDAFWIDRTEVTNAQYNKCVSAEACSASSYADDSRFNGDDQPVVGMDWNDAQVYCQWAERQLPTEAQWEKAARGTSGQLYPWGNQPASCEYAVMNDGSGNSCGKGDAAWPVGSKPRGVSLYGALDMAGNVWEWVADWYDDRYYANSPSQNPQGPSSGRLRVMRGASLDNNSVCARAACRYNRTPVDRSSNFGFRCVDIGPG